MKTNETKSIEAILFQNLFAPNNPSLAKRYGCAEVTVGFPAKKITVDNRKEIVDFLSYDKRADNLYCYEIKVSLTDLKSDAAKSFYGNYNYLVVTEELYDRHREEVYAAIPDKAGIIVCDTDTMSMRAAKTARKIEISDEAREILKDSLLRSLFYKYVKSEAAHSKD